MKILVLSDLHGILPERESSFFNDLDGVELLLICGDIMPLSIQFDIKESRKWLSSTFVPWIKSLNTKQTIFIAGNHDFFFERNKKEALATYNGEIKYLHNTYYDYLSDDGKVYRIFGTPYCKQFGNWAFMRNNDILLEKYSQMPDNTDIVISHDAPRIKELGCILQEGFRWYGKEAGNEILAQIILEKKPSYCFCGHIHSGEHNLQEIDGIKMANASIVDEYYNLSYKPLILYTGYGKS